MNANKINFKLLLYYIGVYLRLITVFILNGKLHGI